MTNKKQFKAVLALSFLCATALGTAILSSNSISAGLKGIQNRSLALNPKQAENSSDVFANAVELGRDELTVDVVSLTSTPASKSATLVFNSSRLAGYGTAEKNSYTIIDDDDYSGSLSNPSLSNQNYPNFNGYIIEMDKKVSYNESVKEGEITVKYKTLVIPSTLTYATSFKVTNSKIIKDAFIFAQVKNKETGIVGVDPAEFADLSVNKIVIPKGLTIESKAIQNVPSNLKIFCEDSAKPATWADDWCDAKAEQITWNYTYSERDEKYRNRQIGTEVKYYGALINAASNADISLYSVVDDVNWNNDFDNPVRTSYGLTKPYKLNSYINLIEDVPANKNLYIPEVMSYGADNSLNLINSTIAKNALVFPKLAKDEVYTGNIEKIYIPSGIETIESGAFKNVPNNVEFYCEATERPIGWSLNWCDLEGTALVEKVHWGSAISQINKTTKVATTDRQFRLGNEATQYILGYKYTQQDTYVCEHCFTTYTKEEAEANNFKCPLPECEGKALTLMKDNTPEANLPIIVRYEVVKADGSRRTVDYEMPLLSEEATSTSQSYFDSVKTSNLSRSFDILLDEGETLDQNSFKVGNIFKSAVKKVEFKKVETKTTKDEEGKEIITKELVTATKNCFYPDEKVNFFAKTQKSFKEEVDISRVITYKYDGTTTFGNYINVRMLVNKTLKPYSYWYDAIGTNTFDMFIENGDYSIRYAFYNISNAHYRITYYSETAGAVVQTVLPIKTPNSVIILEKNKDNNVAFLLDTKSIYYTDANNNNIYDFEVENLKQLELLGLRINIHLWNNSENIIVGRSNVAINFGAIDIMPKSEKVANTFNINTFVIIFTCIYVVIFAGASVGLYFYFKNKYKNDEFRRMNTKHYIKNSALGLVGSLVVALAVVFIILRLTVFKNAISVHNPIDAFIVVPGVISIIIIGYFIKFVITKVKASRTRKKNKKLKLDQDTVDDGTH